MLVVDSTDVCTIPARRAFAAGDGHHFPARHLIVVSGLAGAGKTDVLRALARRGEQVLDLEALASHRGSVFGGLGQPQQPSHEEFQTRVAAAWQSADPSRPLFVEDEGEYLGSVGVPRSVLARMRDADHVLLETPHSARVSRLLRDYGDFATRDLAAALRRAAPRLGSHIARTAHDALERGDRAAAVSTLLPFYDRAYAHRLARNGSIPCLIRVDGVDVHRAADAILAAVADAQAIAV